ncbi:DNA mismatch repair protein Mlh3 isoform X2 [Electrophorus electricus]|uniref:DNA mismatch repair protein Mlh3 isoform X2 n=1 Tax=Electrophorus electricus TaxID=8005 RepID=UPI0015D087FD|nr:DNA mismatch repair protein Mlh3 isoform X2 [Electrophorus electricus]
MIRSLSKEVQAKLRSGIAIFSLQQCVEEVVLNSIDAGATCVAVKIDIEACTVQVMDNGSGMDQENMERVGIRYCTSKCSSVEDLDNLHFYGFRGEAIASIASLAALVEITSRTKISVKTFVKTFNEGKVSDVFEAQTTRPSAGTTVLVSNFFYNMPVRRKRMDAMLETERIRQRVEAISLMHPSVSFTVKKDCSGAMLVQLSKARNTYYRFVQIHGLGRAQKLGEVNYSYGHFQMTGHIGREGHYSNSLQFLFVNSRLLFKTRIHKLLNCLLRKLGTSSAQNSPNAFPVTSSPKQRSGADLHGVYVINIKCHYSEYDICLEPAKSLIEFKDWDSVLFCIEEGIKAFLTKENLVSEFSISDIQKFGSIFSDLAGSPGRNSKTVSAVACHKNTEGDFKDTGPCSTTWETTIDKTNIQDGEIQSAEHILQLVPSNAECRASTDSDTEREIQSDGVDRCLQDNSVLQTKDGKEEEMLDNCLKTKCPIVKDNGLPLSLNDNKMTHCENTKVAIIGHKQTQDSLRRFSEPHLGCAPKRKLSLCAQSHKVDYNNEVVGTKVARVPPRRKLTLSFETGSLDKFKRMFGKGAETKHQSMSTQITDCFCPTVSRMPLDCSAVTALHTESSLLSTEERQVEDTEVGSSLLKDSSHTLSAYTKIKCSTSARTVSLASKLSHLKADNVECKKPYEGELKDTANEGNVIIETLPNSVTQCPDYTQRFTGISIDCMSESNEAFSEQGESSGTTDLLESDRSDEPVFTAPCGQRTSKPTSVTSDALLASKNIISPGSDVLLGQIVNPLSLHDHLLSETGYKEQTPSESQGHKSDETVQLSDDWLTHYDDSLGKMVYINQVTGLSKYDAPLLETQVPCSTDVTNMAVSVVSKTDEDRGPSSLSTLFSEWNNPVFVRPPQVAIDVTSSHAEGLAVKIHNILFPYRFTKDMIHSMKVIHQVDKKFLACLINTTDHSEGNLLVLVDQHAAHERVRLEGLVTKSYEDDPDTAGKKRLCSSSVSPPLEISLTEEEMRLLRLYQPFLRGLAIEISFPQTEEMHVLLERLPTCFIEKESTEQRRGRHTVIKSVAKEYLWEHIGFLHSTGRVRGSLPLTVHNVLASQACHGAIKFNHVLSKEECCSLVASLSSCQLPFQCAHGRPSIVPLVDLLHLDDEQDLPKPNLRKLRRMYKAWQLYGRT